jgi:hypothetical protein
MKRYVTLFDPSLYVNDVKTPLSYTMRVAEIVRGPYDYEGREVIDVEFLHDGRRSDHHFTSSINPAQYFN